MLHVNPTGLTPQSLFARRHRINLIFFLAISFSNYNLP
jgi:hypothetical protein